MSLTKIYETCSIDQRHEISRLKHTPTEKNVITVDEIVGLLNHKGQKQTSFNMPDTQRKGSNKV